MGTYDRLMSMIEAEKSNTSGIEGADLQAFHREFIPLAAPNKDGELLDWDERLPEDIRMAWLTIQRRIGFVQHRGDPEGKSQKALEQAARLLANQYDEKIATK